MSTCEIVYVQRVVPLWEVLWIDQPMRNIDPSLQKYYIQIPGSRCHGWDAERGRPRGNLHERTAFQYENPFKNA